MSGAKQSPPPPGRPSDLWHLPAPAERTHDGTLVYVIRLPQPAYDALRATLRRVRGVLDTSTLAGDFESLTALILRHRLSLAPWRYRTVPRTPGAHGLAPGLAYRLHQAGIAPTGHGYPLSYLLDQIGERGLRVALSADPCRAPSARWLATVDQPPDAADVGALGSEPVDAVAAALLAWLAKPLQPSYHDATRAGGSV